MPAHRCESPHILASHRRKVQPLVPNNSLDVLADHIAADSDIPICPGLTCEKTLTLRFFLILLRSYNKTVLNVFWHLMR